MKDMISDLIQIRIDIILFYFGITAILLLTTITILTMVKLKKITTMLKLGVFVCGIIIMSIFSIVPRTSLTFDLIKDYNEGIILTKKGVVEKKLIRNKHQIIEIENEQFILFPNVERVKEGQLCELKYLKYSKYVHELSIEENK